MQPVLYVSINSWTPLSARRFRLWHEKHRRATAGLYVRDLRIRRANRDITPAEDDSLPEASAAHLFITTLRRTAPKATGP
jgi:hypothetical protein